MQTALGDKRTHERTKMRISVYSADLKAVKRLPIYGTVVFFYLLGSLRPLWYFGKKNDFRLSRTKRARVVVCSSSNYNAII